MRVKFKLKWIYQFLDEDALAVVVIQLLVGDVVEQLFKCHILTGRIESWRIQQSNCELLTAATTTIVY